MNKENKIVPRLRFPEFQGSRNWKLEPFSEIYRFFGTNSFTRDNLNYKNGNIRNIHYGDIHTKFDSHFDVEKETVPFVNADISVEKIKEDFFCKEGDVVFADASEDLNDIGKSIEIINTNEEKILSGLHTLLARPRVKKLYIGFGGHLFKSPSIRTQIQKEAQGAKVLGISATRLSNILVYYPENKTEQQKIASCLSSLDELIAAHTNKLEALKDHKKGLMQQLFPAEGETLPKLRFKEFEKDGEWVETMLGEVCEFVRGPFGGALKKEIFVSNGYAVYEQSHAIYKTFGEFRYFINEDKFQELKRFSVKADDLIMSCSGTMGKFAIIPESYIHGVINQALLKLTVKKGYYVQFMKSVLELPINQEQILSQAGGGAIKNVASVNILQEIKIMIPSTNEQQKIANFLSSIDDEITAQTQIIETFKEHKKGLMQGLFPVINE
jgi:type I restriction enzyme S subunit